MESVLTKGLIYWQVCLDLEHGGARHLVLLEHYATLPVEHSINATHGSLWALKHAFKNLFIKI